MLSLLLLSTFTFAGSISLQTKAVLEAVDQNNKTFLQGYFEAQNFGDETAYFVTPELDFSAVKENLTSKDLTPGEKYIWQISFPLQENFQGTRPLIYWLNYKDANGYNFSISNVLAISLDVPATIEQKRFSIDAKLIDEGNNDFLLNLAVTSHLEKEVKILPHFALPKEISLNSSIFPLNLKPEQELQIEYTLKNNKGLAGSLYRGQLILEWKEGKIYDSEFAQISIPIQKERVASKSISLDLLAIIILAFVSILGALGLKFFWYGHLEKKF